MSDKFSWTASIGKWWGVGLHLHLYFLLFATVVFCVEWHYVNHSTNQVGTGLATVIAIFLVALIHELAHGFAATTLGGQVRELTLMPWGGDSEMLLPPSHKEQLIVYAAGPFINAVMFLIGTILLTMTGQATLAELCNPLMPNALRPGMFEISMVKIITWVNFQMFIVNMIPASPFDASKIIRSCVLSYNPRTSSLSVENALLGMGIASGLLMFLFAWLFRDFNSGPIQPTWFVLVVTGILLIFSARYGFHCKVTEAQRELQLLDDYINYDILDEEFESTDNWLSDYEEDVIADWLHDQQSASESAERSVAVDEDRRVDMILEKLHANGIESLSDDERSFLDRISQQYRRRRELPRS